MQYEAAPQDHCQALPAYAFIAGYLLLRIALSLGCVDSSLLPWCGWWVAGQDAMPCSVSAFSRVMISVLMGVSPVCQFSASANTQEASKRSSGMSNDKLSGHDLACGSLTGDEVQHLARQQHAAMVPVLAHAGQRWRESVGCR